MNRQGNAQDWRENEKEKAWNATGKETEKNWNGYQVIFLVK